MDRTAWLVTVAFVLLLGGGAWLIAPMVVSQGSNKDDDAYEEMTLPSTEYDESDTDPKIDTSDVNDGRTPRERWPVLEIRIAAKKPSPASTSAEDRIVNRIELSNEPPMVVGAQLEGRPSYDEGAWSMRVRPDADIVWIHAKGAQWTRVQVPTLLESSLVTLRPALVPVSIRVLEADGTPAADVPVGFRPFPAHLDLRTDKDGLVNVSGLPLGLVAISANSVERSGETIRFDTRSLRRDSASRSGTVPIAATLTVEPAWTIKGRAIGANSNALAGAKVRVMVPGTEWGRGVTCDRVGRFEWRGPVAARAALEIASPGVCSLTLSVTPPAVGTLVTHVGDVVVDEKGFRLEGTLLGLDQVTREPGESARIEISPAVAAVVADVFGAGQVVTMPRVVEIGQDGSFAVDDVPADLPLRVALRGAGVDVDVRLTGDIGSTETLEMTAVPGDSLEGRVLLPSGDPAMGQPLLFSYLPRDGDAFQPEDVRVVTNHKGQFRLTGITDSRLYLRSYRTGCRSLLETIDLPRGQPLELRMEAALTDKTRRLSGVVRNAKKEPLAGATVRAAGVSTTSLKDGRFVLEGVESLAPQVGLSCGYVLGDASSAGPLNDEAHGAAKFGNHTSRVSPGSSDIDIVLPTLASIRLRAMDGIDDAPIRFAHMVIQTVKGGIVVVDRGFASHGGVFSFKNLPPTGLRVSLLSKSRRWHTTLQLKDGEERDLGDVLIPHGFRVTGTVTDKAGTPLAGATIGALDEAWQMRGSDISRERELLFRSTVTDAKGHYELDGLDPSKPAQIAYCAVDHAPRAKKVVPPSDPKAGSHVKADIKLEQGAFLILELFDKKGVFGALVDLEYARDGSDYLDVVHWGALGGPVASSEAWRRASDLLMIEQEQEGLYIVGPLMPGPYDLIVERPGYDRMHQRLTLIEPGIVMTRSSLDRGDPRLFGRSTQIRFHLTPTGAR